MNLTRLNHILIPTTKAGRDRFRQSRAGRAMRFLFSWLLYLSDEGIGAFLLWLIAGSISLNVGITQFYFLWSALTGLLVASVLFARWFRLTGVSLKVEVPRRIAVGEEVTFSVAIENRGARAHQFIRCRVPFLPWDGTWRRRPERLRELLPGERAERAAAATFSARGPHHLDVFQASAGVPFGLALGPPIRSGGVRFLVVPRIAPVRGLVLPLASRYQPGGVALASVTGESRELVGVRPYRPGDPVRDLHAATWARVGEPVVREYRQEYFTRVGVVVDTDLAGSTEAAFEAALSLAAGLVAHLSRGESLVDLLVLGDDLHRLTLGRHLGFLDQALDLLACVTPGGPWSSERLQAQLEPHLKRLSAMLFVALDWEASRRAFGDWVSSRGVGFRSFHVIPGRREGEGRDERHTPLAADDIDRGNELWL